MYLHMHTNLPCFKVFSKTPTIIALIFLLLSIVVLIAVTLVQINHKEVLSPGLKVSFFFKGYKETEQCTKMFLRLIWCISPDNLKVL
uniref:Uncharacterized protein n=1 Tax=Pelusios castaneus TaxID=367368 RepID=A0A8C8SAT1_9SAUR